jgi:hypothetical protein
MEAGILAANVPLNSVPKNGPTEWTLVSIDIRLVNRLPNDD